MSRVGGVFGYVLLLMMMCFCVESCVQKHIQAQVPEILMPGYVVAQVNLESCGTGPLDLISSVPDFRVEMDGTIRTVLLFEVPSNGKSFWITVKDNNGHRWFVKVSLSSTGQVSNNAVLKRAKRRWSPPPFSVKENHKGPFPFNLDRIASDTSVNYSLYYIINGPGVSETPKGLFSVDTQTGMLICHGTIDREQYPKIVFVAHAYSTQTNRETDQPLPVTVIVEDENDNPPQFSGLLEYSVEEQCAMGTVIGQVSATDKDEPDTLHTKIKFTLLSGTNFFRIDPYSGVISAATNTLDREATEKHFLDLEIRDMGGAATGLFSRAQAVVSLTDINDNPPTFTQAEYKGQVLENQANVLVARIPVNDRDLNNTPNWNAVYEITKGNESGNFMIKTDPVTNEGLLYIIKPLDYEKQDTVNVEVMARNEAPLVGSSSTWQKVPVTVNVENVDEGPEFSVPVLLLRVKENVPNGTLIGTYTAIDPETKSSKDIKYYKLTDRGSWINVIESTGELKTAMTIDRESPLVYNNTYNITVKAVDNSQKSGTGTVIILIEDVNDNVPIITKPNQVLCSTDGTPGSITIEAKDLDQSPYSDPFTFNLGKGNTEQWKLKSTTGTTALLQPTVELPSGVYEVPVLVTDLQGFGKEQIVSVRICKCIAEGVCPRQQLSTALGKWGILALLLGLLMLLLLCLLCMLCACGTTREKIDITDDGYSKGMLITSNFEAPGEEVKESLLLLPAGGGDTVDSTFGGGMQDHQTVLNSGIPTYTKNQTLGSTMYTNNMQSLKTANTLSSGHYGTGMYGNSYKKYATMSTMDGWKENGMHIDKKLSYFREEADMRFSDDILKSYGHEGVGSSAGSVGCCTILSEDATLDFLDSLGPKFKTLADVCNSQMGGH